MSSSLQLSHEFWWTNFEQVRIEHRKKISSNFDAASFAIVSIHPLLQTIFCLVVDESFDDGIQNLLKSHWEHMFDQVCCNQLNQENISLPRQLPDILQGDDIKKTLWIDMSAERRWLRLFWRELFFLREIVGWILRWC